MKNTVKKTWKNTLCKVLGSLIGLSAALFFTLTVLADTPGTITGDNVNLRSEANTTSTVLAKLKSNESVTIIEETNGSDGNKWYKIKTNGGTTGYVRSDFVKSGSAAPTTTVTAVEEKKAYINSTGAVNIRKEASTKSDVVANAQPKSEVTVTGETTATDGYKWYQIKFTANGNNMTGFIRSDLLTFTAPKTDDDKPAETTIEGNTGEDPGTEEPSETPSEETPANSEPTATTATLQFLEPVGEPANIPADYKKVDVQMGDQIYSAWAKGDYYIVYGISGNSEAQWYVYDFKNNSFVSYNGLFGEEAVKKSSNFNPMVLVIILGILAAIFLITTIIFALKAFSGRDNDDNDDYDIDYDDDDEDEDEGDDYEEFDDDYDEKPAKTKRVILPKKAEKEEYYDDEEEEYEDDEEEYEDDEEEEYVKPSKAKKAKKEKKSFKNKILDYFTVSEEEEDDEEEEYEDEDEYDEDSYEDDEDVSFIDL